MDKANAALADYLLGCRVPVHLVAHRVHDRFTVHPLCAVHLVSRPLNATLLGGFALAGRAERVAAAVTKSHPRSRVVVNGGNAVWADINWVHSVHRAWSCRDEGAPPWFKVKNRVAKRIARNAETAAIPKARLVIANSQLTARNICDSFACDPQRVRTVYLGSDEAWRPPSPNARASARATLCLDPGRPVVAFVGALSYDNNKGMDILVSAWRRVRAQGEWQAQLVVAGGGSGLERWRAEMNALDASAVFLGHTDQMAAVLAASDLLVSPVRYEAYGMNVHEAICHGVPAIISGTAGISERYPADARFAVLDEPEDAGTLATMLMDWYGKRDRWALAFEPFAAVLRQRTWQDMAADIVQLAESAPPPVRGAK
jgi:glycosyltransferase involved in cell wall biosynthesis